MSLRSSPTVAWLAGVAFLGGIWISSSMTMPGQHVFAPIDKLIHMGEYAAIGLLFARASLMTWSRPNRLRVAAIGALVGSAFGLSDELHQAFVPGRTASLGDLVADVLGACIGAAIYLLLSRPRTPSTAPAPANDAPRP